MSHEQMNGGTVLLDMNGIEPRLLKDRSFIVCAMFNAVKAAGSTIVKRSDYMFPDRSWSINFTLAESHIAVHTYPSEGRLYCDITACGDAKPEKVVDVLKELFACDKYGTMFIKRPLVMDKIREDRS